MSIRNTARLSAKLVFSRNNWRRSISLVLDISAEDGNASNSQKLHVSKSLPICPRKRTPPHPLLMSQRCHFQTWLACILPEMSKARFGAELCDLRRPLGFTASRERNNALLVAFPLGVDSRLCLLKCITFPNVYATSLGSIVLTKVLR